MYVHDNYGGSGPNGGAGISIQGERYKAQRVKITHCWLSGNGWPGSNNGNLSNIVFFADYQWRKFPNFDTTNSLWGNEVSYNLLENSAIGFKHKGAQFLCMNHEGSDMSAKERGSRVHHNIMRNCHEGMLVKMDFMQIHNNIAENCGVGIQVNDPPAHGYRELFHNVCYNFQKGWSEAVHNYLTPPYHPYFYLFNNILHSKSEKVDADNSTLALYPRYTKDAPLEMSTLHMASNLFLGRVPDADAIRMGMHNFSAKTFVDNKWAHDLWAMDAPDIFQGTEGKARFLPKADLKITADKTYADAGCGAKHPYLDGVEMPKYIGAVDPADADWVDEVEAPALK
jgi:hypothetical protein